MEETSVLIARSQAGEKDAREVLIEKIWDWYIILCAASREEATIWRICFR